MKKTFSAFLAVATVAGALAATPASAQRGVAALRKQGAGGAQQPVARRTRALLLLVGGFAFHTVCM